MVRDTVPPRRGTVAAADFAMESLEQRQFLSAPAVTGIPANINLSRAADNQSEGAVAIDPSNPSRVFVASNQEYGTRLLSARSSDGGKTWTTRNIATGKDIAGGSCDPSVAFDNHGNLFFTYMNAAKNGVQVALSTDGGVTFKNLTSFRGDIDQPTITTGPYGAWITFQKDGKIFASGVRVRGLGKVALFTKPQAVPGSTDANFGDIAIGPKGQVMVTYLSPVDSGRTSIYTSVDANGLGVGGFSKPTLVTNTNMVGFKAIPAQSVGTIDAEPGLAYDRSGGSTRGRVYLVYTATTGTKTSDTNVYLRYSGNDGTTWSPAIRVNDDTGTASQFLPRIAVDQTTGNVAMSWHDSRMDLGASIGSTNRIANDDAQFWGVVGKPTAGGVSLSPNFQISAGTSNADAANNGIDYGDYTGLAYQQGVMIPVWADNSNSTGNNPGGRLGTFDLYTARITPVV